MIKILNENIEGMEGYYRIEEDHKISIRRKEDVDKLVNGQKVKELGLDLIKKENTFIWDERKNNSEDMIEQLRRYVKEKGI